MTITMHAKVKQNPSQGQRSYSRETRRPMRRPVTHVALPGYEIARAVPKPRETITAFLRRQGWAVRDAEFGWQFRNGLPTILEINGEPVLRRDWRKTRIAANDNVRFISKPLGGGQGGKQILGLVALVAVSAFAMWAGPALAGALGFTGAAATVVGGVATAGIAIGGSLLVNSLTAPKLGATNAPDSTVSQIYTAQAQGNAARLGQPLPAPYGREKVFPDFAAAPWSEFVGNDQYQNILLSVGMDKYSYEQMFVDDTPCWNPTDGVLPSFASMQVEFYAPGEEVDLFPTNVAQAAEVTGQSLPDPNVTPWIGPFIANPAGTKAQAIAIDFVFPGGCFTVNQDNGDLGPSTVELFAEIRPVNDAGAPIGDFTTLFAVPRTYNSRSPIRDSVKTSVPEGRFEVRFRRSDAPLAGTTGTNEVIWAGLRAFLKGNNSFPDVSTIAIRIKATESTQGSFRFGVLRTRILRVWDNQAAQFVEQPSRSPIWAFYDMATNPQYGAGVALQKVDFNTILSLAAQAEARGDHFDYTFSSRMAPADAFDKALTVARCKHCWLGDVLSAVRDEWRDVPTMLLTDREIVRGTTQVSVTMLGEDDPDAVVLEYIDEETWRPAQVQYPPNSDDFTSANATPIQIDGIVNRDHAFREAAFYYRSALYRRENVQVGSEYEGRALTFGSTVRLQSELPQDYGQAGAILSRDGAELTLDPAPVWNDDGQHFMRVRRANGKFIGPFKVAKGNLDAVAVINTADLATIEAEQGVTLDQALAREDGGEYPSFELEIGEDQSRVCLLLTGQPNGPTCTLNFVVDDPRVHDDTDIGTPPALPSPQYPTDTKAPEIAFLQASFRQGIAEPILDASWWPAPGARFYTAEISYDARLVGNDAASWIKVYESTDNKFSTVVDNADLRLRVQATADRAGTRSFVDIDARTIVIAPGTVAPSSLQQAIRDEVGKDFEDVRGAIDQISQMVQEVTGSAALDKRVLRSEQSSLYENNQASIQEVLVTMADEDSALAASLQTLSTTVGDNTASLDVVAQSVDGIKVQFGVVGTIDGETGGLVLTGAKQLDGSVEFQIAISGDVIIDKTLTADKVITPSLEALSGNLGHIVAGDMTGHNGLLLIDLDNVEIAIFQDI
jgi:hypothetical protein